MVKNRHVNRKLGHLDAFEADGMWRTMRSEPDGNEIYIFHAFLNMRKLPWFEKKFQYLKRSYGGSQQVNFRI